MASRTIFEQSEPVPSPSGRYFVEVSSQTSSRKTGLSQAVLTHPANGTGTGLIAFYSPRVPMAFSWRGDEELTVRYPTELPRPDLERTNSSFGHGGRVIYEAVPRAAIPPVRWSRAGSLTVVAEKKLERGVLLTFDANGRREHAFSYCDMSQPDSSSKTLRARKLQGGGASWAGIVHGLVALRAPELTGKLDLDPESDGLTVRSASRAALLKVAKLVALAKQDGALLLAAIERATADGEME